MNRITPKLANIKFQIYFFWRKLTGIQDVTIEDHCRFYFPENIKIGDRVYINHHAEFIAKALITIGNDISIGQNCLILTNNKLFTKKSVPIKKQGDALSPVTICDNVWIGANVTILSGVKIGTGAVIGAGAVVTRSIPSYGVAVGVPAKVIKKW